LRATARADWTRGENGTANTSPEYLALVDPLFGAVRDLTARVEALELPPGDPPPPVASWTLLRDLATVGDWDGVLNEAPGSTITDQSDGSIRLYQPNRGERCELQCYDQWLTGGVTARYSWEVWISSDTQLDPSGSGTDTMSC